MRASFVFYSIVCATCFAPFVLSANILMITMGGTKSHKIPFWELSKGLIARGHNITFLSGFATDFQLKGLQEVTPKLFVNYIQNYTNWDLMGARYAGRSPISLWQAMRYPVESCESLLSATETAALLRQKFHLAIVDGAFPECALGIVHRLSLPFVYMNTVGFYTGSLAAAGNPIAYAVTPHVFTSFAAAMSLRARIENFVLHLMADAVHRFYTHQVHRVLRKHLGPHTPHPYVLARNVSYILQNGHPIVTHPRALYPNVAEIACLHCRPARALPTDLEEFVSGSALGFIYFSMGSSVRAANMPETLRKLLVTVFARLSQYQVLWQWGDNDNNGNASVLSELSPNVRLSGGWLPQQDVLGHRKLRAFITHGGLLSLYEAIYHAVPMVMLPVFCDHDVNTASAMSNGYAVHLSLAELTAERLYVALNEVIHNKAYHRNIRTHSNILLDQQSKPLETAVFWTEYVLRHKGAAHLQPVGRHMSFIEYHSLDVMAILVCVLLIPFAFAKLIIKYIKNRTNLLKNKRD